MRFVALAFTALLAFSSVAFADPAAPASPAPAASAVAPLPNTAPVPAASAAPAVAASPAAAPLDMGAFFSQALDTVKSLGGLSWGLKIAAIISLLIASMRVSAINAWTWAKLPNLLKPLVGPVLGLIGGLLTVHPINGPALLAWVMAGGGAVLIDNVLDGVKSQPGLSPLVVSLINFFESLPVVGSGTLTQPVVADAAPAPAVAQNSAGQKPAGS